MPLLDIIPMPVRSFSPEELSTEGIVERQSSSHDVPEYYPAGSKISLPERYFKYLFVERLSPTVILERVILTYEPLDLQKVRRREQDFYQVYVKAIDVPRMQTLYAYICPEQIHAFRAGCGRHYGQWTTTYYEYVRSMMGLMRYLQNSSYRSMYHQDMRRLDALCRHAYQHANSISQAYVPTLNLNDDLINVDRLSIHVILDESRPPMPMLNDKINDYLGVVMDHQTRFSGASETTGTSTFEPDRISMVPPNILGRLGDGVRIEPPMEIVLRGEDLINREPLNLYQWHDFLMALMDSPYSELKVTATFDAVGTVESCTMTLASRYTQTVFNRMDYHHMYMGLVQQLATLWGGARMKKLQVFKSYLNEVYITIETASSKSPYHEYVDLNMLVLASINIINGQPPTPLDDLIPRYRV